MGETVGKESEMDKTITEQLQEIAEDFCNHYCKHPDTWDEEAEGCDLSESDVCSNCPMGRLV